MKLSVCMMIKDEEKYLKQCLDSINNIADEIIIVDSVASYSPIVIKYENLVRILTIEEFFDFFDVVIQKTHKNEEIKNLENIEVYVWNRMLNAKNGSWNKINYVLRHNYSGILKRINTLDSVIDITPNHSLFHSNGKVAIANNLSINDCILQGELKQCHENGKGHHNKIFLGNSDLAWAYGFFVAEGSCFCIDGAYKVKFSNAREDLLKKCSEAMEYNFNIIPQKISDPGKDNTRSLYVNGEQIFKMFNSLFYDLHRNKRIPSEILNAPENIRRAFIEGYMAGDGSYDRDKYPGFSTSSWLVAQGLIWLYNSIGMHNECIHIREDKMNMFEVRFNITDRRKKEVSCIKKILDVDYNGMVYDISTNDGKFQTGIGTIFAHNTGSTDKSIQIAQSYSKVKLYHHPWEDNFSLHRNQSIFYSTGDWLLFIDADEKLFGNYKQLKPYLEKLPQECTAVQCVMKDMHGGQCVMQFNPTKIFRKGHIQFKNIVHNQPVTDGLCDKTKLVYFEHYGYDVDEETKQKKVNRTITLLHKRITQDPDDFEAHFYLCQMYGWIEDWKSALKHALIYIANKEKITPFNQAIYFSAARICLSKLPNKLHEAKEILDKTDKKDIDILLALSEYYAITQNHDLLKKTTFQFLNAYKNFDGEPYFIHCYTPQAYFYCASNYVMCLLREGVTQLLPEFQQMALQCVSNNLNELLKKN